MPTPIPVLFQQLCDLAGRDKAWRLRYVPQQDRASAWRNFAIHPMQVTETAYQRWVLDALAAVHDGTDDARRKAESDALSRVFQLGSQLPALATREFVGELPRDVLDAALEQLREISTRVLHARVANQPAPDVTAELLEVRRGLFRALLLEFPEHILDVPEAWSCIDRICRSAGVGEMQAVAADVSTIVDGFASVQVSSTIDSFYLFRLLVRTRIVADRKIDEDLANEASGAITGLLHNAGQMAWLGTWLFDKLCDLDANIRLAAPGQDVIFFLKGGRAMQDDPRSGQNDWDTQLVINPYLPPAQWYALFARIHDLLVIKLTQYKNELYVLLCRQRQALEGYVAGALARNDAPPELPQLEDVNEGILAVRQPGLGLDAPLVQREDAQSSHEAAAKAELIDIGIPRRESAEAFEQWNLVRPRMIPRSRPDDGGGERALLPLGLPLVPLDGQRPHVNAPSGLFFAMDFLLILREVFAGESRSVAKAPKRVKRLYEILGKPSTMAEVEGELLLISEPFATTLNAAWQQRGAALDAGRSTALMIIFVRQLVRAYDLLEDRDFARAIAALLSNAWARIDTRVLPNELNGLTAAEASLARTVATIQDVGMKIVVATRNRAAMLPVQDLRRVLGDVRMQLRQLPRPQGGWSPSIALVGSAALNLHARALDYARVDALEAVYRIDAKIFMPPGTVMQQGVKDELRAQNELRTRILSALQLPVGLRVETPNDSPPGTMLFYSRLIANNQVPQLGPVQGGGQGGELSLVENALASPDMQALVLRITTEIREQPPRTTNLDLPVTTLRDLLNDYTREAGEVDEFCAHGVLTKALTATREMLTSFEPG